jgi:hypothetical protein
MRACDSLVRVMTLSQLAEVERQGESKFFILRIP